MDIVLNLVSFELTRFGSKATDTPPPFMTWPGCAWSFTLTDGLKLAVQAQALYHNVTNLSSVGDRPVSYGKCILDYDGTQLRVTTEFKCDGWYCETKYLKRMRP